MSCLVLSCPVESHDSGPCARPVTVWRRSRGGPRSGPGGAVARRLGQVPAERSLDASVRSWRSGRSTPTCLVLSGPCTLSSPSLYPSASRSIGDQPSHSLARSTASSSPHSLHESNSSSDPYPVKSFDVQPFHSSRSSSCKPSAHAATAYCSLDQRGRSPWSQPAHGTETRGLQAHRRRSQPGPRVRKARGRRSEFPRSRGPPRLG